MAAVRCPPPVKFQIVKSISKDLPPQTENKFLYFMFFLFFMFLLADLFHRDAVLCYAVWRAFLVMLPVILNELVNPGPVDWSVSN
jgi:hypothetical protein